MQASGAYAVTVEVLRVCLSVTGYQQVTAPQIEAELHYLRDKGFAEKGFKTVSPENSGWRITAAGRDHLAMEGLA